MPNTSRNCWCIISKKITNSLLLFSRMNQEGKREEKMERERERNRENSSQSSSQDSISLTQAIVKFMEFWFLVLKVIVILNHLISKIQSFIEPNDNSWYRMFLCFLCFCCYYCRCGCLWNVRHWEKRAHFIIVTDFI